MGGRFDVDLYKLVAPSFTPQGRYPFTVEGEHVSRLGSLGDLQFFLAVKGRHLYFIAQGCLDK